MELSSSSNSAGKRSVYSTQSMSNFTPNKKVKMSAMDLSPDQAAMDIKALNLFSRQNAALGAETTARLTKMKVLIYGLRGAGVETCKNLALQGVGAITLVDPALVEERDMGVNFFLTREDVGISRASVVAPKLRELNPLLKVSVAAAMEEDLLLAHSAVVVTQTMPLEQLIGLNEMCRANNISFFYVFTGGVSVDVFVDHGDKHMVNDANGERPMQKLITDVVAISEEETLIRYETPEGQQPVALNSGFFEITEVTGVDALNGAVLAVSRDYKDPVKTVRVPYAFPASQKYLSGGLLTEKKLPFAYPMQSLATKLKNPGDAFGDPPTLVLTDLLNFGSEVQQHVAFYATLTFLSQTGKLPAPNSAEDAARVVELAKELLVNGDVAADIDLDEALVTRYALHAGAELQPMAAFIGGVLAQEVVKCTGKFTPIPGFMHFSCAEALPEGDAKPSAADVQPRGSRYDELAAVYGWPFVEKLGNLKYFMVGCGALGCELMKNFALNGVCCGPEGKLWVTDADRIELSNLSRQFLFREHNVGQSKSRAAAAMATVMNGSFNVEAMELFVGSKTEEVFHDDFWMGLDGICNALDNMEARLYVDRQTVKYEKSLLESGTMGTGGNIDTICPFKTRTYAEGGTAAEGGGVPMCTLRNFPHLTDHCIEWARDQFELLFAKLSKSLEAYIADPLAFESKINDKAASEPGAAFFDIRSVISLARFSAEPSIGGAAQLAFDVFHFLFRDRILDLQAAFPQDFRVIDDKTKEDKGPFWGEKKRFPTVCVFNPLDSAHTDFVLSATCMFSVMVGLIPPKKEGDDTWLKEYREADWIANITAGLSAPAYMQAPVNSDGIDNAPAMDKEALSHIIGGLCADLRNAVAGVDKSVLCFEAADFEKDDDLNFHISFITSAANLRCDNYTIKRTDFHSCKVIAGKIIAAIATTTAAVCGLVIFELFKLQLGKDTEAYMNRAIGLSGFTYTSFTQEPPYQLVTSTETLMPSPEEPLPAEAYNEHGVVKEEYLEKVVHRAYPEKHTVWDKITCSADLTLSEFSAWLLSDHGLKLRNWDFIYGSKIVEDEDSKSKVVQGVSAPVYPPKPVLNYSLIPSLELTLAQASMAIMKTAAAKPTQQYLALWREFKAAGTVPAQPEVSDDVITNSTTLRQILQRMVALADEAEAKGLMQNKSISSLKGRRFIVIPGSEAPLCSDAETGEDIEHLCALKITL